MAVRPQLRVSGVLRTPPDAQDYEFLRALDTTVNSKRIVDRLLPPIGLGLVDKGNILALPAKFKIGDGMRLTMGDLVNIINTTPEYRVAIGRLSPAARDRYGLNIVHTIPPTIITPTVVQPPAIPDVQAIEYGNTLLVEIARGQPDIQARFYTNMVTPIDGVVPLSRLITLMGHEGRREAEETFKNTRQPEAPTMQEARTFLSGHMLLNVRDYVNWMNVDPILKETLYRLPPDVWNAYGLSSVPFIPPT